jgi:3-hydroxyisobutyrate dehydrogenase-like beta-hydroxyacid dehydrogenase
VEVLITMLADDRAVQDVIFEPGAAIESDAAAAGKLFIVSVGPSEAIEKCGSLFAAMGQKTFMINEDAPAANLINLRKLPDDHGD